MTVAASAGYRKDYTGNGVTVNWPVPFYFLDASHLQVILTNISVTPNVSTSLTLNSDYTVDGAGTSSGGSITTMVAYSSSYKLTILRNVPLGQDTHYVEGDKFPASGHEQALDKLTMIVQQQAEVVSRAVTLPAALSQSGVLPNPAGGQLLGWNGGGTAIVNYPPTINSAQALQVSLSDTGSAANGAGLVGLNYALSYSPGTVGWGLATGAQTQVATAFATGGTAPSFTLTPVPAAPSLTAGLRFRVKWGAAALASAAPTLNVSGLGPVSVKTYASDGSKLPANILSGTMTDVEYDGTHWVVLDAPVSPGSLIGVQVFASAGSSTYTPSPGTNSVVVEVQGGGGAGGGAPATAAGQVGIGIGGSGGATGKSRITSGFSGVTITVGAGGSANTGSAGGNGGASSFGALISAPGGPGGAVLGPSAYPYMTYGGAQSSLATGGSILNVAGGAAPAPWCAGSASFGAAAGGTSMFAPGGAAPQINTSGNAGRYGSGGSGTATGASAGALAGGAGGAGLVIVYEYA